MYYLITLPTADTTLPVTDGRVWSDAGMTPTGNVMYSQQNEPQCHFEYTQYTDSEHTTPTPGGNLLYSDISVVSIQPSQGLTMKDPCTPALTQTDTWNTFTVEGGTSSRFWTISLTKCEPEDLTYLLLTPRLNEFMARTSAFQCSADKCDESFFSLFSIFKH